MEMHHLLTETAILEAHNRIRKFIHNTPVISNQSINDIFGSEIFFKCENFQKIGAFKFRGAMNAILSLSENERAKGIATHSSGNHAQAIAKACQILGLKAFIVMPNVSNPVKVDAVKNYGAEIIFCENNQESREQTLAKVVAGTGAYFIHPYDDERIIAGQGTAAKELIEEIDDLDIIMAPIGGGGLMSGTILSSKYFSPNSKIIGCEPKLVDDAFRSWKSGKIEGNSRIDTIADGLRTTLGVKTFPIISKLIDEIITVKESSILQMMQLFWERTKIIIEPSSAVPLAAVYENQKQFEKKKVGIIISGGNVDFRKFFEDIVEN